MELVNKNSKYIIIGAIIIIIGEGLAIYVLANSK